jgi:hypothetical protein
VKVYPVLMVTLLHLYGRSCVAYIVLINAVHEFCRIDSTVFSICLQNNNFLLICVSLCRDFLKNDMFVFV